MEQKSERESILEQHEKALSRLNASSRKEKATLEFLNQKEAAEANIAKIKQDILNVDIQISESESLIAGGFQEEADALEEVLRRRAEEQEKQNRIEAAQKRINDRIKEYEKTIKDVLKPLQQVESQLQASLSAQTQQGTISDKLIKERLKLEQASLKTELGRATLFEQESLIQEIQRNQEQQITIEANKQLEALQQQKQTIESRQKTTQLELERARAILESEQESVTNIKNKKEQKAKLLEIEEALDELNIKEGMFAKQQAADAETLAQLEQNRMNTELNAIEQINQVRQQNHEQEIARQEKLKETIKGNLNEALNFGLERYRKQICSS
jgi:hypothetical protein